MTWCWAASSDEAGVLPVPHADFFQAARSASGEMVLNDAKVHLAIESLQDDRITARVLSGGPISAHKGITFTASDYRVETLSEKDQAILAQTAGSRGRALCSFVREGCARNADVPGVGGAETYLIAKLERGPAMQDARAIAAMRQRGLAVPGGPGRRGGTGGNGRGGAALFGTGARTAGACNYGRAGAGAYDRATGGDALGSVYSV